MVRYSEGPTASVSIDVPATVEAVWDVISDPGFPAAHSTELQEASWDADGPEPGVGARILGRNQHPVVGEWTTTSHVTTFEAPHLFAWAVVDPDNPSASWSFELSDDGAGGTTVTQRVTLGPGRSGLSPAIEAMPDREEEIVERRLQEHRDNITRNLEALRAQFADE